MGALLAFERVAGGAVRFIAHGDVELRHARVLRAPDHVHRLVGAEHDGQPVGRRGSRGLGESGRIGGRGDRQVVCAGADVVALANLRVGADGKRADRRLGVSGPLAQRLRHERDRRCGEQHATARPGDLLGGAQRGEGLAGAAGHDQLAAVVLLEAGAHVVQGALLVRAHFLARQLLKGRGLVLQVGVPVDRRGFEPEQVETLHRRLLVGDQAQQVAAPVGSRADDQAFVEVGVRVGEEIGQILFVQRPVGVVALALDGRELAVGALRDDVDADVAGVPARPLSPGPSVRVSIAEHAIGAQHFDYERLELSSTLPGVWVALAELPVDVGEGGGHRRMVAGRSVTRKGRLTPPRTSEDR